LDGRLDSRSDEKIRKAGPNRLNSVKVPPPELAERLWAVSDEVLAPGTDMKIDDLAALAGVPRATLYYYFAGKDDVLAFLLAQKLQRGTAAVASAASKPGDAVERLRAVLTAMLETLAEHPELCLRLLGAVVDQGRGGQLMDEIQRTLMAPVRALLAEAHDAGELVVPDASTTTLAMMGAVVIVAMVRTTNNAFDPESTASSLIPLFLDGLCPREPSTQGTARRATSRRR
jgi:AcrR family transcriptional regulator